MTLDLEAIKNKSPSRPLTGSRVHLTSDPPAEYLAVCSGLRAGVSGRVMKQDDRVPEGKLKVRFRARDLGYSGGDPIVIYVPLNIIEEKP